MEKEHSGGMPKAARYPVFLIGLVVLIFGGLASIQLNFTPETDAVIATVGFALVLLSVLIR